jgi:hypothetical protein
LPKKNGFEADFFGVLADLSDYLADLTLVGGWVPYVYSNFLWHMPQSKPIFTSDVDWGLGLVKATPRRKTLFEALSALAYSERHLAIGKLQPIVFYRKNKTRLDFIVPDAAGEAAAGLFLGREVAVSPLEDFEFLLRNTMRIKVRHGAAEYLLCCPTPAAFALHKCATFTQRNDAQKMAKDLYYAYFVLRHSPFQEEILTKIRSYSRETLFLKAVENIKTYFTSETSRGCVMVAGENGPDPYIENLGKDVYARFIGILG